MFVMKYRNNNNSNKEGFIFRFDVKFHTPNYFIEVHVSSFNIIVMDGEPRRGVIRQVTSWNK